MSKKLLAVLTLLACIAPAIRSVHAQTVIDLPADLVQAIVQVRCEDRQGSGTVINSEQGYVLTNAHVVSDLTTQRQSSDCVVAFPNRENTALEFLYRANIVRAIFNERRNQDFAILRIGEPLSPRKLDRFPAIQIDEFPIVGQEVRVFSYPRASTRLVESRGIIQSFEDGFIRTTAEIAPGSSGGAGLDRQFHLIGIPTRIVISRTEGARTAQFDLVDIRAVITWLDTFGPNEHDLFFTHADSDRYHRNAVSIEQASLGCEALVRTQTASTLYCLTPSGRRLVFPNEETFLSWFSDFSGVQFIRLTDIATFPLTRNVTFKPGTLVKSTTLPRVYVVIDTLGTMRWVPTEERARELWGQNWASLVRDIPDEFFSNYTIGQPLE
jgi:hypothetical protein